MRINPGLNPGVDFLFENLDPAWSLEGITWSLEGITWNLEGITWNLDDLEPGMTWDDLG